MSTLTSLTWLTGHFKFRIFLTMVNCLRESVRCCVSVFKTVAVDLFIVVLVRLKLG